MIAEPGARTLVQQNDDDAIEEQHRRTPHHQAAHLVEKAEIGGAVGAERNSQMLAHDEGEREQEYIADQQTVDRLAHHHRVLADIEQQQQHQLAGEQHGRTRRRDDAERQRDVENAGQIGFEEMHDAERAEKSAEPDAGAGAQQHGERGEINEAVANQQEKVVDLGIEDSHQAFAPRAFQIAADCDLTISMSKREAVAFLLPALRHPPIVRLKFQQE